MSLRCPQCVVFFSGGIASWATASRIRETYDGQLDLLFTDTKMEDEDLYRFLREEADDVNGNLIKIEDGRDPWQVFFDVRLLGNSGKDPCSRILKRQLAEKYVKEHYDPNNTTLYIGLDWTELHRVKDVVRNWQPYTVKAPLCDPPLISRNQLKEWLSEKGISIPRLYKWSEHNNCGGFCIKAGHGHFAKLLANMPERYAYHEQKEQDFRDFIGKNVSILRDRSGGKTTPLTLREFRERIESGRGTDIDMCDIGGCGCFV